MPGKCSYPQSQATRRDIQTELAAVTANQRRCASVYLDTVHGMSNPSWTEGDDHHQGLARTHKLSDGSIYFFLSNSETDPGDQGGLSQYRYHGPTNHDHFLTTRPLTVAPMAAPPLLITEQHPSDITFLPEVDGRDAGYLLVTEEFDKHNLTVYRWQPGQSLAFHGVLGGFPANANGPQFVFIDLVGDEYYLGLASTHWGFGKVFRAPAEELFPACKPGGLELSAFERRDPEIFELPAIDSPSQTKLVRDSTGAWYLLGFRSDRADAPMATTGSTAMRSASRRSRSPSDGSASTCISARATPALRTPARTTWSNRGGCSSPPRIGGRSTRDRAARASSAASTNCPRDRPPHP